MAKYESMSSITRLACGTVVWAYAFQENGKKDGMALRQTPIRGRLSGIPQNTDPFAPHLRVQYFVPFKKNSQTEYAWSKAAAIYNRNYADTEAEAIEGYNALIDKQISWYHEKITALEGIRIRTEASDRCTEASDRRSVLEKLAMEMYKASNSNAIAFEILRRDLEKSIMKVSDELSSR